MLWLYWPLTGRSPSAISTIDLLLFLISLSLLFDLSAQNLILLMLYYERCLQLNVMTTLKTLDTTNREANFVITCDRTGGLVVAWWWHLVLQKIPSS